MPAAAQPIGTSDFLGALALGGKADTTTVVCPSFFCGVSLPLRPMDRGVFRLPVTALVLLCCIVVWAPAADARLNCEAGFYALETTVGNITTEECAVCPGGYYCKGDNETEICKAVKPKESCPFAVEAWTVHIQH